MAELVPTLPRSGEPEQTQRFSAEETKGAAFKIKLYLGAK